MERIAEWPVIVASAVRTVSNWRTRGGGSRTNRRL